MDNINNVLDTAKTLNNAFKNKGDINKKAALEKIQTVNVLLTQSTKKIEKLEEEIKSSNSSIKNNSVIESSLSGKKSEIAGSQEYFSKLEKDIKKVRSENINLKSIIRQKENEMIEKDNIIARIKAEREEKEQKLQEVIAKIRLAEQKISQVEKDLDISKQETKKQKARTYYETGMELRNLYDNISPISALIGGKITKKDLINQSYAYFKKSYELGYPDAKREMLIIEIDKKYSKNLN